MKKLIRKHPEALLVFLAMIFFAVIVGYFFWGVGDVVATVNRAADAKGAAGTSVGFNLQGAKALDLRGLVKQ